MSARPLDASLTGARVERLTRAPEGANPRLSLTTHPLARGEGVTTSR